ncbi:MAG TPA: hypothetical protein GX700_07350 [Paracoccus sp.]|nr:hypothetical protein [Paracoccus sp. (in: a-proteobacteria)]
MTDRKPPPDRSTGPDHAGGTNTAVQQEHLPGGAATGNRNDRAGPPPIASYALNVPSARQWSRRNASPPTEAAPADSPVHQLSTISPLPPDALRSAARPWNLCLLLGAFLKIVCAALVIGIALIWSLWVLLGLILLISSLIRRSR